MKNAKKIIVMLLAFTLLAGCFAGCGKTVDGKVLKIGGIGPLTGDYASYGVSVKQGAEIAIEEINAAGGINGITFKLEFQDDETDGSKAKSAYEKLKDNGMQVLMGAVTSGASVALNDLTKEDGLLQITPSGSQQECTDNPNSFRICFTDPLQGKTMAEYCYKTLGYKKAAIIFNQDDSYSTGITAAFKKAYTDLGGTISEETSFAKGTSDFNAQLTKVQASDAEFLFMPIYNADVASIAVTAKSKGITLPMIGCDGWDGIIEKYLKTAEQYALIEGAIYLTPFVASDPNEKIQKFVSKYNEKYNATPDQFAADGYDAIYTFAEALKKAGITDTTDKELNSKLVDAMTKIEIDGLTGKMTFTAEGEPNKGAKVAKIINGQYVAQ